MDEPLPPHWHEAAEKEMHRYLDPANRETIELAFLDGATWAYQRMRHQIELILKETWILTAADRKRWQTLLREIIRQDAPPFVLRD